VPLRDRVRMSLAALLVLLFGFADSRPAAAVAPEILVAIEAEALTAPSSSGRSAPRAIEVRALLDRLGLSELLPIGPAARFGGGSAATAPDRAPARLRFARLDVDGRTASEIEFLQEELRASGLFRAVTRNRNLRLALVPNDPYYVDQWHVLQLGNDADIDLVPAWDLETGDAGVTIAILDTGVDLAHPDLSSKIRVNSGEVAANGLDDDGNGYIDDVRGWDFGDGDASAMPTAFYDPASGIDAGFHGTFGAGLAAAASNNGVGIVGVAWQCRILPLKISNASSEIPLDAVTEAVEYAADNGAHILNMSFGAPGDSGVAEYFQALVDLATDAGALVVAAAGNDGLSDFFYPAACDGALSVGATDDLNQRASFSNWGAWVDVAAPGQFLWSSICRNYTVDFASSLFYQFLWAWDGVNPYMYGDGTSFASPIAAGVAALVLSQYPGLPPALLEQHLIATGDALTYDQPMGPKVNAHQAVLVPVSGVGDGVVTAPRVPPLSLAATPNPFVSASSLHFALEDPASVRLTLHDAAGRLVRELDSGERGPGEYTLSWDGRLDDGRAAPRGVYFARIVAGPRAAYAKLVRE
jgi:subtilisin family serine protease